jgi:hypothetical protein
METTTQRQSAGKLERSRPWSALVGQRFAVTALKEINR